MKKLFLILIMCAAFSVKAQLSDEGAIVEHLSDGTDKISLQSNPLVFAIFAHISGTSYELRVKDEVFKTEITYQRGTYTVVVQNVIQYNVSDDGTLLNYTFIGDQRAQSCLQHSISNCQHYTSCKVACMNSIGAYALCLIIWETICILEELLT